MESNGFAQLVHWLFFGAGVFVGIMVMALRAIAHRSEELELEARYHQWHSAHHQPVEQIKEKY